MSEQIITVDEMASFMARALIAGGAHPEHAAKHAALLVSADYRGHYSHGLNRLELYVDELIAKTANGKGTPTILKENFATALVDGNNLLGAVVGTFCMELAIRKAKEHGVGFVTCRGSNHYGIAGYYSMMALQHGLLGMSFTNATPIVVPTRSKKPCIGTNPLSLAAPGLEGDSFVLDMAATTVAKGKLEVADCNNKPIPEGWAIDKNGRPLKNFKDFYALLPLGGDEKSSGYKGYGLSVMSEIFCGILSGGLYGPHIHEHKKKESIMDLSHCFIAINQECFAPGFPQRMQDLMDSCRGQQTSEGEPSVIVAGDPEREHMRKCDELGGIPYHVNQVNFAFHIADKVKIQRPKFKNIVN